MTDPTWTYTAQQDFVRATIKDEQGELIAIVHNHDNGEANEIAALIAAAPRLLIVAQMSLAATCCEPTAKQLTELWQTASEAYRAATEASQ
jgi:hypothetical protein